MPGFKSSLLFPPVDEVTLSSHSNSLVHDNASYQGIVGISSVQAVLCRDSVRNQHFCDRNGAGCKLSNTFHEMKCKNELIYGSV